MTTKTEIFAQHGEAFRDGLAHLALDVVVAVDALEAESLRDRPAHGRFARAHEADQVEIDVRGIHRASSCGNLEGRPGSGGQGVAPGDA